MANAVNAGPFILADRGDGRMDMAGLPPAPGMSYAAYPVIPGGVLHPYINDITNQDALWEITAVDGNFDFFDGGAWQDLGGGVSFTWRVQDYDSPGSGNTITDTYTV